LTHSNGRDERQVLVAAGTGPDVNGWLVAIHDTTSREPDIEVLDNLNTSGMITVGGRVYRVLSSPSEPNASGDFLVYDVTGVIRYSRVDGLADSHGLVWDGTHFVVPCSFTNEIFWLSPSGETARIWRAPGEGDAWHINGLFARDGKLFASAFGRFATHRGWAKRMGERVGHVFDVESQRSIIEGLACPHDPVFVDGGWLVCDSYTKRLLFINESTGTVQRSVQLNGWSRGLAMNADRIFVGVSGERHDKDTHAEARIVVIERSSFRVSGEIKLACLEINALAMVPESLLGGIRRGFRTNDLRVGVQDRRDLFERAGQGPVPIAGTPMRIIERPRDFRVRIYVKAPRNVKSGEYFDARISIKNRSRQTLFTAAPFPVNIAIVFYEIGQPSAAPIVRREALPEPLVPGATIRFTLPVQSPHAAADYRVRFTLVQEWVRWFDTDERWLARALSANRRYINVRVRARESPHSTSTRNQLPVLDERPV
jgi:acetolactate synthase-1/2/3 large subunit